MSFRRINFFILPKKETWYGKREYCYNLQASRYNEQWNCWTQDLYINFVRVDCEKQYILNNCGGSHEAHVM